VDITDVIQHYVDNYTTVTGFVLYTYDGNQIFFHSKEYANVPYLDVSYY